MFASALTFNPRSKATNIGYLLSLGAVFWLWKGIAIYHWKNLGNHQMVMAFHEIVFQRADMWIIVVIY